MTDAPAPPPTEDEDEDEDEPAARRVETFPVVALGASAGGLAALEAFFERVDPRAGMAYVVITHQHPDQPSLLPELLGKRTPIPVVVAADGTRLEPDRVYLPPTGAFLATLGGVLHVVEPPPTVPRLPIDHFFRALAADVGPRAVGIVLSGTGSDGTEGIRSIKAERGVALAQDEASASYPSMPRSALATGVVDAALPPGDMPAWLGAYGRGLRSALAAGAPELPDALLQKVFLLLRQRTGHDFSLYKPKTVRRRVERRLLLHQLDGLPAYLRFLADTPDELDKLFQELLIGVTSFFREPSAYAALGEALRALLQGKPSGYQVRVWVPGCSTGEEAYSIAMLLRECLDRLDRRLTAQVFATDINDRAIALARAGVYPEGIAADVSPERLERFFQKEDGHFRVSKQIRELVIFAPQDLLKDPPFTRLDLVSCRNLLIYLQGELQRRLLSLFHYALRPDGLLLLGSSESLGGREELFLTVDKRWKLFRRRPTLGSPPEPPGPAESGAEARRRDGWSQSPAVASVADRVLLELHAPPSVFVTARGEIVHVRGRTGQFLEPAEGQPSANILNMTREGLGPDLALALRRAAAEGTSIERRGVRVKTNGDWSRVDIQVRPLQRPELRGLFVISFLLQPEPPEAAAAQATAREDVQLDAIEQELLRTRESLQATVEELEASNEELRSTNEELQSTNEEFQSTNEELETSKEELQSLNEELQTVNAELQEKILELSRTNDDMSNLLNSTDIATVFLDGQLRIKRFTPQAKRVIKLIDSDVGRPIGDLTSLLEYDGLLGDAQKVLDSLVPRELEVRATDGRWFLVRMLPYRTSDNRLDGLVLTFVEVSQASEGPALARGFAAGVVQPLLLLDERLTCVGASRAFYQAFGLTTRDVEDRPLERVAVGPWSGHELRRLVGGLPTGDGRSVAHPPGQGKPGFVASRVSIPGLPGRVAVVFEPEARG